MEELVPIIADCKDDRYAQLYPQLKSLVEGESDDIANMANISAALHATFGFWWTGFYRVIALWLAVVSHMVAVSVALRGVSSRHRW